MGHRAYLLSRTEAGTNELFEANNLLPFFWLTLLDQSALAQAAPAWDYASRLWLLDPLDQESYADTWPAPTNFVVEKPVLLANIARAQRLLQARYPDLMPAYQEFTRYLLANLPGADDQLQLDMFALAAFTSPGELLQSLGEQLTAIERQQPEKLGQLTPDLLSLVGFPGSSHPPGPAYPQLASLRARPRPVPPSPVAATAPKHLWSPVAGLLLLYSSYLGYQREGLSWLVSGVALLGAVATAWGIVRLRRRLRRA